MNISKIKLTEIKPAEYNPRKISKEEMQKLKNSIKTFGLTNPIIINLKNNTIIGGHQRYDALVDMILADGNLAEKEFDLIEKGDIGFIFDVDNLSIESEDHEKALNIALNKISGEWDLDKLQLVLEDLDMNDFDVSITGFDDVEISELMVEDTDISEAEIFGFDDDVEEELGTTYYEPVENDYQISDLYKEYEDLNMLKQLTDNEDLQRLIDLRLAWFCEFNFKKIADYYAYKADETEQQIFEKLGLVLLDRNQMIEHGFLKLYEHLDEEEE